MINSGSDGSRAPTEDETNRLAITRFRNYELGGRGVRITVPNAAGRIVVTASVDYRAGLGYGVVHGEGRSASGDGLIQFSATSVLLHPMARTPARAPATPPATGWFDRPLSRAGSALDTALAIAVGLGNDRPDNAQLLPQNGAMWLGSGTVRGHRVDIMAGPSARARPGTAGSVRYWLADDGTMYRVEAAVASEPAPVLIEFGTQDYVPVRPAPGITGTR